MRVLRFAAACLALLLAGCSATELAYNNADTLIRWQAGRYLDLKNPQAEEFNARLAAFLVWHRSTALPQYARLASEAGARLERAAATELSAARSHAMLCGNPQMVTDVTTALGVRGMRKHRRRAPGHITVETYW